MDKGHALLTFLKATTLIRRKRISSYGPEDKVFWIDKIPKEQPECRSPFLSDKPEDFGEIWLEIRKKPMPKRPPVPKVVENWVRANELENPEKEPKLQPEITVLVEQVVPDPNAPGGVIIKQIPEVRRLDDHPEVQETWLNYLIEKWHPWAQEMRRWKKVQSVYEELDFMHRRLEEAEERYELVFAMGLLQWRDPTGTAVRRHVLTAPAELMFDAARGVFTVVPAASFKSFRIELDMLDPQHQPRLNKEKLENLLEELDFQAWKIDLVKLILHEIANSLRADAQVDEGLQPQERVEERPCLSFAPALVLRERRSTAYEDLICKFLQASEQGKLKNTVPWLRLIQEGESSSNGRDDLVGAFEDRTFKNIETDRLLFPLPSNEEQRQIAYQLQNNSCVLVKGPPGTGKSHTIANLICHLLAKGERILVTAHAPKALTVLRNLLPAEIRDLCVTALGSSREDQQLLEESVRKILARKNEWQGPEAAKRRIEEKERELRELEDQLAKVERELREIREAETYSHQLPGGYSGTAAQIARMVNEREQEFSWFSGLFPNAEFPLNYSESQFLADAHAFFTADIRSELQLKVGASDLLIPSPDEFSALVTQLTELEESAQRSNREVDEAKLKFLETNRTEQIYKLREAVQALSDLALSAEQVFGKMLETILKDLLTSAGDWWTQRVIDSETLQQEINHLLNRIGSVQVELPNDIDEDRLRRDVERRLAHFEAGGWKGFLIFSPRVVRETNYVSKFCLVNGKKATKVEQLRYVRDYLELQHKVRELRELWNPLLAKVSVPRQIVSLAEKLTAKLKELLKFFNSEQASLLRAVLGVNRLTLASEAERYAWLKAINALLTSRKARETQQKLDRVIGTLRSLQIGSEVHPCICNLEKAAQARDVDAWRAAWQKREYIRQKKEELARYESLLNKLDKSCPGIAELLRSTSGDKNWNKCVRRLQEAWHWAYARTWLQKISKAENYEKLVQEYHLLKRRIEKTTEELVALRAWKEFFDRLDEKTFQSLISWKKAMERIGKGTGKYAYRHRRAAQKYLMDCVPKIPAWIMPLHKLWNSVEAVPGLFDTVIVDEASQAGIDALVLFLLAKRIVIVGDDKQNSPEAVGVPEDDIKRLTEEYLHNFYFRYEFRPDTSLFDHAERVFGKQITLREHFRCVPEIIRFSNDLCYRDTPLIPLRQAPPKRLLPCVSFFVPNGACEGEGPRIQNHAEAEAIVETIVNLVENEDYKGKTMGVIALQGHAQARLIENLLVRRLDPRIIEERRLRCGEPATFQGDERDVIFLSLVIAPNVRFRALTGLADIRRFNVAMSRARDQVWLFHSVELSDLSSDDLRHRLIRFFKNPPTADVFFEDLEKLEHEVRKRPRKPGTQPEPYESWFEVDVALELMRRKFRVRPQVEVAGYRIDLVVEGLNTRLAVECDGDTWHGPEQYERDMARQRQLERAGWRFVRVRESDFYTNREQALAPVLEACKELGIQPFDFIEQPQGELLNATGPDSDT